MVSIFEKPSKEDIRKGIKAMIFGKKPGIDQITAEVLNAGDMLHKDAVKVWTKEISPLDWLQMIMNRNYYKGDPLNSGKSLP